MSIVSFALEIISGATAIDIVNGSIMFDMCDEESKLRGEVGDFQPCTQYLFLEATAAA